MKKILVTLLVLALCTPAMAATVSFVDNADGTGTFTITATELIVGVGLDVDATADVSAVAITPAVFNIYPDAGYSLGVGYTYGAGGPVAAKTVPGEITLASSPQDFALSFGNLNGAATAGADGANVVTVTFTVTGGGDVTIGENATRGGVVGTLGEDIALTGTLVGTITDGSGPCYTGPDAAEWVAVGSPAEWCTPDQCHGNASNSTEQIGKLFYAVGYNDIDILLDGFSTAYTPGDAWIAADFDHADEQIGKLFYRVGYNDIDVLLAWFSTLGVPTDCQSASPVSP